MADEVDIDQYITKFRRYDGWTFYQLQCNEHTAADGKGCGGTHVFCFPPPTERVPQHMKPLDRAPVPARHALRAMPLP